MKLVKMVNKCVAAGCSNGLSQQVILFKFPRDLTHSKEQTNAIT